MQTPTLQTSGPRPSSKATSPTRFFLQEPFIFVPHNTGHMRSGHRASHLQRVAHVHQEVSQVLREPRSFQSWGRVERELNEGAETKRVPRDGAAQG